MRTRHTLSLSLVLSALFSIGGCGQSHSAGSDAGGLSDHDGGDGGGSVPPDGAAGVCCPISGFTGCSPGSTPLPAGGWAASADACTRTISGFDGRPFASRLDAQGCPTLVEVDGCCGCPPDAGVDASGGPDSGVACDGLSPAACLAAGCAPDFDDACCPMCTPGGCADCTNLTYHACEPYASACLGGPSCGVTPAWGCGPVFPSCDGAHAVDVDSCDRVGCVPGYPSGTGDPEVSAAVCVPITAESCTVACRRLPPPCPTGTTAEGDGDCYTDRCLPAFVCE